MDTSKHKVPVERIAKLLADKNSKESYFKEQMMFGLSRDERQALVDDLSLNNGWNRMKFIDICLYINLHEEHTEEVHDIFGGFIDSLIGFVEGGSIIRLPTEPPYPAWRHYFDRGKWLKEDSW
ncbi:MAG: hypothetical protein U0Y10_17110 [Spirosomataceae bacterium]